MADPVSEVLGVDNIVGVIQTTVADLPRPLPDAYYTVNRNVSGDSVGFDSEAGERQAAPYTDRTSPSRNVVIDGMTQSVWKIPTVKLNASVNPNVLQNLRAPGGTTMQKNGQGEVARRVGKLNKKIENTRLVASHYMLLGGGKIWYDSDGNLLYNTTGSVATIDCGIPAGNLTRGLRMDGSTRIISATWATAGTDIAGDMEALLLTALQRYGAPIDTIVYGANIFGHICANTAVKSWLASNAALAGAFTNLAIPNGFLGVPTWIKGAGSFWNDSTGTNRTFVGANDIVCLPAPNSNWLENVEGSFMVPNGPEVYGSLLDANASFVEVTGKFAYAGKTLDPPGATMFAGDTFLPFVKVPEAIYKLTPVF